MVAKPKETGDLAREDLIALSAKRKLMNSRMAEERGTYGSAVAALEEKGLDTKVFNAVLALTKGKNPAGITATLNRFDEYVTMMGLRDQADIESFLAKMPDTRTQHEKEMDGDVASDNVVSFDAGGGKGKGSRKKAGKAATDAAINPVPPAPVSEDADSKLAVFKTAMKQAETPAAVNRGLEAFISDNPTLDEAAIDVATARIDELNAAGEAPPTAPDE